MTELGLESGRVRLVAYDDSWPALYATEIARIRPHLAAAGTPVLEHTGSTAVPGLAAKPIIDILAGLAPDQPREPVIAALQAAGYVHHSTEDIPGHDFFRRGNPRQYHLHLTRIGSRFWHDHRLFRDWLLAHSDSATEYATLKQILADQFPNDREAYIDGKTAFVSSVLEKAKSADLRFACAAPGA